MSQRKVCSICDRPTGSLADRDGELDEWAPLGPVTRCPTCKRLACPDCLHEAECCFVEADKHWQESKWTPKGWRMVDRIPGLVPYYERVEAKAVKKKPENKTTPLFQD